MSFSSVFDLLLFQGNRVTEFTIKDDHFSHPRIRDEDEKQRQIKLQRM